MGGINGTYIALLGPSAPDGKKMTKKNFWICLCASGFCSTSKISSLYNGRESLETKPLVSHLMIPVPKMPL